MLSSKQAWEVGVGTEGIKLHNGRLLAALRHGRPTFDKVGRVEYWVGLVTLTKYLKEHYEVPDLTPGDIISWAQETRLTDGSPRAQWAQVMAADSGLPESVWLIRPCPAPAAAPQSWRLDSTGSPIKGNEGQGKAH
jgi:hypothetical protein